jgi:putative transposase
VLIELLYASEAALEMTDERLVSLLTLSRRNNARAHITGRDDVLVRAAPMLQLVDDWRAYLGQASSEWEISETQRHLRNGRPLGSADFVDTLETRLGRDLQPQQPGPKRRTTGN